MVALDEIYMRLAVEEAWRYQLLTYPNPAVGAVVVKDGRLLSVAAHKEAGGPHAEVEAIKEAYMRLSGDHRIAALQESAAIHDYLLEHAKDLFYGATIYVTLEPCHHYGKTPPCSLLLQKLGFGRVVVALAEQNDEAAGGIAHLRRCGIDVDVGVCAEEAERLLEPFVKWSRGRFIFFKLAQHLNGGITGGTISSNESRTYVHKLRQKIDLLLIGGSTVRIDRPRLDTRLVGGRAPDVMIYSRKERFDRTIPLFEIPERRVQICSDLAALEGYRFVMIEGGSGMLEATKGLVDWYLFFVAPTARSMENYQIDLELEFLHTRKMGRDLMVWSRDG